MLAVLWNMVPFQRAKKLMISKELIIYGKIVLLTKVLPRSKIPVL
jgi:hypothetical protein